MKLILLTPWISPHQMPVATLLAKQLGENNFRYHYLFPPPPNHTIWGWDKLQCHNWLYLGGLQDKELETCNCLLSGVRAIDVFRKRNQAKKQTVYISERWFKPPLGMLRLLVPTYFWMAWQFCKCAGKKTFWCLPMGVHAARDMARLQGLFRGDLRCLFRAPKVAFESRPGGVVVPLREAVAAGVLTAEQMKFAKRFGFTQIAQAHWGKVKGQGLYARMRIWGYFVAPGRGAGGHALQIQHPPRVLWVGRMLDLKRVGDLVRACRPDPDLKHGGILLDLYGHGPEEEKLRRLAAGAENIRFHDFVPVEQVRELMREHDIYVLPSNAYEGWGAVVSEALEEGMQVIASIESGSGATILPSTHLFSCGDIAALVTMLHNDLPPVSIGCWTAKEATSYILEGNEILRA